MARNPAKRRLKRGQVRFCVNRIAYPYFERKRRENRDREAMSVYKQTNQSLALLLTRNKMEVNALSMMNNDLNAKLLDLVTEAAELRKQRSLAEADLQSKLAEYLRPQKEILYQALDQVMALSVNLQAAIEACTITREAKSFNSSFTAKSKRSSSPGKFTSPSPKAPSAVAKIYPMVMGYNIYRPNIKIHRVDMDKYNQERRSGGDTNSTSSASEEDQPSTESDPSTEGVDHDVRPRPPRPVRQPVSDLSLIEEEDQSDRSRMSPYVLLQRLQFKSELLSPVAARTRESGSRENGLEEPISSQIPRSRARMSLPVTPDMNLSPSEPGGRSNSKDPPAPRQESSTPISPHDRSGSKKEPNHSLDASNDDMQQSSFLNYDPCEGPSWLMDFMSDSPARTSTTITKGKRRALTSRDRRRRSAGLTASSLPAELSSSSSLTDSVTLSRDESASAEATVESNDGDGRRRRAAAIASSCLREPRLNRKLRQGDPISSSIYSNGNEGSSTSAKRAKPPTSSKPSKDTKKTKKGRNA